MFNAEHSCLKPCISEVMQLFLVQGKLIEISRIVHFLPCPLKGVRPGYQRPSPPSVIWKLLFNHLQKVILWVPFCMSIPQYHVFSDDTKCSTIVQKLVDFLDQLMLV